MKAGEEIKGKALTWRLSGKARFERMIATSRFKWWRTSRASGERHRAGAAGFPSLVNPVASAIQAGIPTVIIDSGLKMDQYISFVATDNYKGGQLAGERWDAARWQGQRDSFALCVGSASTEEREAASCRLCKQVPGDKDYLFGPVCGATRETAFQASQNLLNRFARSQRHLRSLRTATIAMTMALRRLASRRQDQDGRLRFRKPIGDRLKNGDIQGLVVQNPMLMGYLGVMTIYKHLQGEKAQSGSTLASCW